eukprot:5366263-Pleurochrysis_carterae.AAC.1
MSQTCQYRQSPNQSLVAHTGAAIGSDHILEAPVVCKMSSNVHDHAGQIKGLRVHSVVHNELVCHQHCCAKCCCPTAFKAKIDLAWLVHSLKYFAFLTLDFKQAVRACDSKRLDWLWLGGIFSAMGRLSMANTIHCIHMARLRTFWSEVLALPLKQMYDNKRSIPMSQRQGGMVGWVAYYNG